MKTQSANEALMCGAILVAVSSADWNAVVEDPATAFGHARGMMELADDMESGREINPRDYRPRTLKNELERSGHRRRLPATKCVDFAMGLARGLQILHEAGFTHRDVRPSNIIFVNDVPKLADNHFTTMNCFTI